MRANTMPRTAIAVPRNLLATRSDRGSTLAYLRALTLAVWFGSLVIALWWRKESDWMLQMYQQGGSSKEYFYYGFVVAVVGHLTLGPQKWFGAPFAVLSTVPGKLLTAFCVLMALLAPISGAFVTTLIYACATWGVLVLCHLYWASDYNVVRNVMVFTGLLLFAWLFVLLFHHGLRWGFGSSIGSINRNTTSTVALGAMACTVLSSKKSIRWAGFGLAAFFAIIVTSRGSMLALCVFSGVYYAIYKGTSKAVIHVVIAGVVMAALLLNSSFLQEIIFGKVLQLNTEGRGLGSGFSGRLDKWQHGIDVFWERPFFGHGFRASAGGAGKGAVHSGYIKLLVETGIVGTALILSALGIALAQRVKLAQKLRVLRPTDLPGVDPVESLRLNTVACATYCCVAVLWVYEPLYINLGSVISVMFFMMMAAPLFVSVPGPARR